MTFDPHGDHNLMRNFGLRAIPESETLTDRLKYETEAMSFQQRSEGRKVEFTHHGAIASTIDNTVPGGDL